jgi:hypothetical protein
MALYHFSLILALPGHGCLPLIPKSTHINSLDVTYFSEFYEETKEE